MRYDEVKITKVPFSNLARGVIGGINFKNFQAKGKLRAWEVDGSGSPLPPIPLCLAQCRIYFKFIYLFYLNGRKNQKTVSSATFSKRFSK